MRCLQALGSTLRLGLGDDAGRLAGEIDANSAGKEQS
jgi:hypothetical protein